MHHFGDECQRLQRAGAQVFEEKKRGEVPEIPFVGHREDGAEPFEVHVLGPDLMMFGDQELLRRAKC